MAPHTGYTGCICDCSEARLLVVRPWDKTLLKDIEKAILQSDLGLVPMNDGNLIRMAIPRLTEERRKELVKIVNKNLKKLKLQSAISDVTAMIS